MGIFDLFKKKETGPIRPFSSDADKFSTEQIWDWMNRCTNDPDLIPPTRSDEYTKSIIDRMSNESDIEILSDDSKNGVRVLQLSIQRNESDYVSIAYQLFNPNVVYITTAPYGFAGNTLSFLAYCNRFQSLFPMITIGCKDYVQKLGDIGQVKNPMYSLRTCVPLLGNEQDYNNLITAVRCLPIYGYDLRDGYHSNNPQPYASLKSGINIQLEKLVKIHEFKSTKDLYPAKIALYGHSPFSKKTTDIPANLSNPYLQYLNYCINPEQLSNKPEVNEIQFFHTEIVKDVDCYRMERSGETQILCYTNYPGLYTIEYNQFVKINDNETYSEILGYVSEFGFPTISNNPHELGLFKMSIIPYGDDSETFQIKRSITQCIPNEINALVLAMQIVDFFDICSLSLTTFAPKDKEE